MALTTLFFEVVINTEENVPMTSKVHDALLEFTSRNLTGDYPPMVPYKAQNGVWLRWSSDARLMLDQ